MIDSVSGIRRLVGHLADQCSGLSNISSGKSVEPNSLGFQDRNVVDV